MTTKRKITKRTRGAAGTYWLTPKGWSRPCSHCSSASSVAYRRADHRWACASCIERLGIKARESQSWRDGGSRAGAEVRIYFVD